ncbi:hypothetical protein BDV59DRAFT_119752 [Aspergillus ambiguus]|uniref:uncharacterized protein n=1 Tax=Aspergillus ambiguus TaxID=176160 RepID=UPI003CCC9A56
MFDLADANLAIDSACDFNGVVPIGRSSGINRFYYHSMPMTSESEAGRKPSLIFSATAIDGTSFGLTRRDCIDVFRQLIIGMVFCPEVDSMSMGGVGVAQHGNFSVTAGSPGAQRSDDFRNMEPMQYWKYVPSGLKSSHKVFTNIDGATITTAVSRRTRSVPRSKDAKYPDGYGFPILRFGSCRGSLGLSVWLFRSSSVRHLSLSAMVNKVVVNLGSIR